MQSAKKIFWACGVIVGILAIIGPSLASWFDHPVPEGVSNAMTIVGMVVAVFSLLFL